MTARCASVCPYTGARCRLQDGHGGLHRGNCLTWHDPPVIVVGGRVWAPPPDEPILLSWERP